MRLKPISIFNSIICSAVGYFPVKLYIMSTTNYVVRVRRMRMDSLLAFRMNRDAINEKIAVIERQLNIKPGEVIETNESERG